MSDLEDRLAELKTAAAEARKQEARAAATAETLRTKITDIEEQMRTEFEVEPDKAEEYVMALRAETEDLVALAEQELAKVEQS